MRHPASHQSGNIQAKVLVTVVLLAAVGTFLVFLLERSQEQPSRTDSAPGPIEVSRTNLVLEEGRLRFPGASNAFTGLMLEHHVDGALRSRSAITNGVLQGLSQGWFTNGQMQVSENFKEGISHGVRTKWYADGAKQSEASVVDGKIHGTFRKWHPNGVLAEQAEFVADQPEGTSTAWYPSGFLKARVVMKGGKPVEQTFWKDGEKKE
jgi:antitoxin component YwqK of YwqJK toxin-antitoxin module